MHVEDFSNFKFGNFSELKEQKEDDTIKVESLTNPSNILTLYHGTKEIDFKPDWKHDNPNNDYGRGLYLTPELDKGLEWAMSKYTKGSQGFAYEYELNISGLKILKLDNKDILHWICILIENRKVSEIDDESDEDVRNFIISNYHIDVDSYDIIYGYRADDSYFSYARNFLSNGIGDEALRTIMMRGKLGMQYCLKSEEASNRLKFVKKHKASVEDAKRFESREKSANEFYRKLSAKDKLVGRTIWDMLKE